MINFDDVINKSKTDHNTNWTYIPDTPYKILPIGGSGSRKRNKFLNLISHKPSINKICLYVKDSYEPKHQLSINKRKKSGKWE